MAPDNQNPDENERNVYGDEARERLMEDGEISPEEEAFMEGYDQAESEEEDTASDAYEAAFAPKRSKRRRTSGPDLEEEFEEF